MNWCCYIFCENFESENACGNLINSNEEGWFIIIVILSKKLSVLYQRVSWKYYLNWETELNNTQTEYSSNVDG